MFASKFDEVPFSSKAKNAEKLQSLVVCVQVLGLNSGFYPCTNRYVRNCFLGQLAAFGYSGLVLFCHIFRHAVYHILYITDVVANDKCSEYSSIEYK